jgi:hypothetical protein
MILVGNTFTLIAIVKVPELQTRTNMIIASLSIADILVGLTTFVHIYSYTWYVCHSPLEQVILRWLPNFTLCASGMHLFTIATERYIAISYPLHYEQLLTPRRVKLLIAGTWIVPLLISLVIMLPWAGINSEKDCTKEEIVQDNYRSVLVFILYVFVIIALSVLYGKILVIARQHERRLGPVQEAGLDRSTQHAGGNESHRNVKTQHKAAKMVTLIILAYLFTWTPLMLLTIVTYIVQNPHYQFALSVGMLVGYDLGLCKIGRAHV